ncbi:hypothetical protein QJQ45_022190 [Haematococcus lacustris]|nr:hypothetical protein QJQ45_022190 [Haematococcus lacustris]
MGQQVAQDGAVPKELGLDKLVLVDDLLDQNKLLIAEINQNHELKTPDALVRNVVLIKQLNVNVSRVVTLYSELAQQIESLQ